MSMSCIAASALVTVVLPADQWTGCSNNGLAVNAGSVVVSGGIDEIVIDGERPDEIDDESATSTPAASRVWRLPSVSLLLRDRRGGGLVALWCEMEAVLEAGGPMALSGYTRVMAKVLLPHVIYARIDCGSLEELPAEAFLLSSGSGLDRVWALSIELALARALAEVHSITGGGHDVVVDHKSGRMVIKSN
ncbi:uncharacterized protein AMSG_11527 [Thecamonas trahens ATCC 50062]|uniref:Protein kinase domain-containing protein n=1 Tax=Thecamonas trahens ATCC 50062 TaxID=461836 RepID=A0A0L0D2Q2_THETB|nr:hypothetical protein AMSG_11527 [Thecamonas trahens ATCC 50062]KNC46465.1 hypothetical protein AMSG_11527 [Thecamonas trahens ATCC 50062]|eukprot:XP_013752609.1 hypothetical protein AMSG_11527 [Thecamonas trahens ATCC 50062]